MPKNKSNPTPIKPGRPKPKAVSKSLRKELWGIAFLFLSAFLWIGVRRPEMTGFVGYWVVEVALKNVFGKGLYYLPIFLGLSGLALLLRFSRRALTISAIWVCFVAFLMYLERIEFGAPPFLEWPYPDMGGGWIGHILLYAINQAIGSAGVTLILIAVPLITPMVIFDFSMAQALGKLMVWLSRRPALHRLLDRLKQALFYKEINLQGEEDTELKKEALQKQVPTAAKIPKPIQPEEILPVMMPGVTPVMPFEMDSTGLEAPLMMEDIFPIEEMQLPEVLGQEPLFEHPEPEPESAPEFELESEDDLHSPNVTHFKSGHTGRAPKAPYKKPPLTLLAKGERRKGPDKLMIQHQEEQSRLLEETLKSFNVKARVVNVTVGPSVTRFELEPGDGVKVIKITSLSKDIALKLAAQDVRIEAPIPGKSLVGIEVPNLATDVITLRMLLNEENFYNSPSKLIVGMGMTITGESVYMDLAKMPHVLIAGATGAGKSVCINTIILSILMKATPEEVRFLMIDPKKVELSLYEGIPHLLAPVVTNPHKAAATLKQWALAEMERRYELFSSIGVKDLVGFNAKIKETQEQLKTDPYAALQTLKKMYPDIAESADVLDTYVRPLPYIVVIIDELADLMMVASQEVENTICRLAQMARATGIHLVIATQRPSVNVVTGLIKANVPSRVSFFLQSQIDSRTILDSPGAEKLLGKGDMLYLPVGAFKPKRVQGVFVSEKEVKDVVDYLKKQGGPSYDESIADIEPLAEKESASRDNSSDELYEEAKELVLGTQYASTSYLQRKLRIGYNRAARLMDELKENGVISSLEGDKRPRSE